MLRNGYKLLLEGRPPLSTFSLFPVTGPWAEYYDFEFPLFEEVGNELLLYWYDDLEMSEPLVACIVHRGYSLFSDSDPADWCFAKKLQIRNTVQHLRTIVTACPQVPTSTQSELLLHALRLLITGEYFVNTWKIETESNEDTGFLSYSSWLDRAFGEVNLTSPLLPLHIQTIIDGANALYQWSQWHTRYMVEEALGKPMARKDPHEVSLTSRDLERESRQLGTLLELFMERLDVFRAQLVEYEEGSFSFTLQNDMLRLLMVNSLLLGEVERLRYLMTIDQWINSRNRDEP
ncbi:MAG TPA: hypothetical protein VLA04_06380 [Verrucomicrobiae bacterium]|nr:hypothetical protein [Verrucomicrobiae bacterium]